VTSSNCVTYITSSKWRHLFICQGTSTKKQQSGIFFLRAKLSSGTSCLTTLKDNDITLSQRRTRREGKTAPCLEVIRANLKIFGQT